MEGIAFVAEPHHLLASRHKRRRDVVPNGVGEADGVADLDTCEVELVSDDAVVLVEHVHVEVVHVPVDVRHHEVHRVEDVGDFLHRELALVVHAAAVRVHVRLVEPLALGHQSRVAHGDLTVLVDVRARGRGQIVAEDAFHVSHRVGKLLGVVVVQVAHQRGASAVAVAIRLGGAKQHPVAIVEGLAPVHVVHHQGTAASVELDAHRGVVVFVGVLRTAQGVGDELVVGPNHQVVGAVFHVGHVNPLAAQPRPVDVTTPCRNAHVAAAVLAGATPAAFEVHDAKAVLEPDGDQSAVQVEQVVFGVAVVVPMAVAVAPFELVVAFLGGNPDVVIEVADVLDVGCESNQLSGAVAVQASLVDVAIRLVHLHDFRRQAVDDGLFHHNQIGTVALRVARVHARAVVEFGHGAVVAGLGVCAPGRWPHKVKFPTPILGAGAVKRRPTHPVRHASFEQHRQLSLFTTPPLVVVEVNGPFIRVVEVAHLAVIVDVQAGVASVAA